MAENLDKWPSKRRPLTKIMPSDGCKGDTVPLAVDQWYDFHEFGCHRGMSDWRSNWVLYALGVL